jgi:tripartite-type tricarboxylate transporter receptor subunit TctC
VLQRVLAAVAAIGFTLGVCGEATAQAYPNRTIRLVVPFPAGGPPDVIARVVADALTTRLGQTVVVENRPGAGATVGTRSVATAQPDGYTLLYASTTSLSIAPSLFKNVDYDPIKSFAPVAGISIGPAVVVVHPSVPAKTVAELVAHAKANPGKLNYGAGVASPPHIAWAQWQRATGTEVLFVPYRGMAPAMSDLIAGQIQLMIDGIGPLLPHIQGGKVRALAVTGTTRSPEFPDLPTMIEAGYPGVVQLFWTGVVAPAGTPAEIVTKLNAAINDVLASDAMKAHLRRLNVDANVTTPPQFAEFVAAEAKKWADVITSTGIKAE